MAESFLIVGVLKNENGFVIVDPTKQEHPCEDGDAIVEVFEKLMDTKALPEPQTVKVTPEPQVVRAPSGYGARRASRKQVQEFETNVDAVGNRLAEHISEEYGGTIGFEVGKAAAQGVKKLARFARRISR